MKVILDNGHGSNTPGKCSPVWGDGKQLLEYEFNRDIVKRINEMLRMSGIDSVILVPETRDIRLVERVVRADKIAKAHPGSFLISVHANAGCGTGWEAFTSIGETESDKIASIIYEEAANVLPDWRMRKDYSDGDVDKESQFYILRKTRCPAVLTENLFMDTEKDCRFIMSEKGRKLIAKLHVNAIKKYIKSRGK